jgi:hypothetical protein
MKKRNTYFDDLYDEVFGDEDDFPVNVVPLPTSPSAKLPNIAFQDFRAYLDNVSKPHQGFLLNHPFSKVDIHEEDNTTSNDKVIHIYIFIYIYIHRYMPSMILLEILSWINVPSIAIAHTCTVHL